MKHTKISALLICILLICICCACGQSSRDKQPENTKVPTSQAQFGTQGETTPQPEATPSVYAPDSYDTEGIFVLLESNAEEKKLTLYNPEVAENYTLDVVGTSTFADKYGEPQALSQFSPGDVVQVTYIKEIMRLNSMQQASRGFSVPETEKYILNRERQEVTIGKNRYKLPENVLIFSEGKQITAMDLNEVDLLSFQGIGSSIYSIVVEKGHGYLCLDNETDFIDGFIEVGQSKISKITEDMLLTVPEGVYQVTISHNGGGGTKQVTIGRNQEVTLDIGDLEVVQTQYGNVLFSTDIEGVSVYVDGKLISHAMPISLQYGIHQVIAKAEGYETLTGYFKVSKPTQNVELELDKKSEKTEKETKEYKVHIDKPEGAEVYLDGNYIGIAPVSFKKEAGSHTITLRKTGYETRSYTISVDKEKKDSTFTFGELIVSSLGDLGSIVLE
ncbi:MAG: PEGA domain-containing protein [Lachnospiraceae bacterium]|nr:PEGA domain-containing protein [Lachnospiraceae bacterium]